MASPLCIRAGLLSRARLRILRTCPASKTSAGDWSASEKEINSHPSTFTVPSRVSQAVLGPGGPAAAEVSFRPIPRSADNTSSRADFGRGSERVVLCCEPAIRSPPPVARVDRSCLCEGARVEVYSDNAWIEVPEEPHSRTRFRHRRRNAAATTEGKVNEFADEGQPEKPLVSFIAPPDRCNLLSCNRQRPRTFFRGGSGQRIPGRSLSSESRSVVSQTNTRQRLPLPLGLRSVPRGA